MTPDHTAPADSMARVGGRRVFLCCFFARHKSPEPWYSWRRENVVAGQTRGSIHTVKLHVGSTSSGTHSVPRHHRLGNVQLPPAPCCFHFVSITIQTCPRSSMFEPDGALEFPAFARVSTEPF
jgi:hypothetical protein